MANDFKKILELANKNNMGLSNTIKRDYGIPLDYSSVQESYEAALAYAQTSTLAYIGQPISVGDTLYIVTDEAGGYLKAVGTKPIGDEQSITVDENGKIAIKGFTAAPGATLPQKQADGTLKWVAIDAIVEGDGNTKTVVNTGENSAIIITPSYDEDSDTYTYTFDVSLPEVPVYSITKETGDKSVTYKLTKDGVVTGDLIEVPNAFDDTSLINRITELETGKADKTHTHVVQDITDLPEALTETLDQAKAYTDTEILGLSVAIEKGEDTKTYIKVLDTDGNEISKVDASIFVQDSFLNDVTYDNTTGKVTFIWLMGDGSTKTDEIDISHLINTYTAGSGIKVIDNVISVDETLIATKQDINNLNIDDYAKTADVVLNSTFEQFKTDNTEAISTAKQEVLNTVEGKGYTTAEDVANKVAEMLAENNEEADNKYLVDSDLNEIRASLSESVSKTSFEEALSSKADKTELSNNYYKKSETYSQTEVDALLDGIQAGSSESAATVNTKLESYKTTNDARVELIETNLSTQEAAIASNTSILEQLTGSGEGSISDRIVEAINSIPIATEDTAGLVKASDEISVATDGKMFISKVSTDVLVQGAEELILNGGSAGIAQVTE